MIDKLPNKLGAFCPKFGEMSLLIHTLPETNLAPENGWLEYDPFLLEWSIFRGKLLVSGSEYHISLKHVGHNVSPKIMDPPTLKFEKKMTRVLLLQKSLNKNLLGKSFQHALHVCVCECLFLLILPGLS